MRSKAAEIENSRSAKNLFIGAVLAASLIFSPLTLDLTLTARCIAFAFVLLFPLYFLYRSGMRGSIRLDVITFSYLSYTVFCILSVIWAKNKSEAWFESSKVFLALFAFAFTYFAMKQDKAGFLKSLYRISVLLFYSALTAGIYQYFIADRTSREFLYALTGLNSHKNLYASFLFLNLYFLIAAALGLVKSERGLALGGVILNIAILLFLRTKAVWIGLFLTAVVAVGLLVYKRYQHRFRISLPLALILWLLLINLFFICVLPPLVKKGISYNNHLEQTPVPNKGPTLDQERLIIWDKTYHMIRAHPFFGVGMGNWQIFFPDATLSGLWRAEDLNYTFQRPHNDFLWILSETGIIGFNLFLFFLFALILLTARALKSKSDLPYLKGPGLVLAFVVGYFAISFFDFPKERMEHQIWINVLLGICYYHVRETSALKSIIRIPIIKMTYAITSLLLICVLIAGLLRYKGEYYTRSLLNGRGNYQLVIKAGQAAMSFVYTIDPTSLPIPWYIGNAHAAVGNYKRAHECLKRAYLLNPFNRNVLNDLASSFVTIDQADSAKLFYQEASRISPRFDDPKLNLAAIYINEKKYRLADDCLKSLFHDSERRSQYQRIVDAFNH